MTDIILSKKTERLAEQRLQAPRCDTLLAMPTAVGGDETLRAPGRGSPTRSSTNERLGSRTAHGNGTAFSAVAPSERPVLPSIDPNIREWHPPGPNAHTTSQSVIRFPSCGPNLHCLTLCDPFATYRPLTHSPASTICRCITVP